jgi:hypothetical protein
LGDYVIKFPHLSAFEDPRDRIVFVNSIRISFQLLELRALLSEVVEAEHRTRIRKWLAVERELARCRKLLAEFPAATRHLHNLEKRLSGKLHVRKNGRAIH